MSERDRAARISAIRDGAAVLARPEILTLRATGPDRVRFLNGMLSNDVTKLSAGQAQRAIKASSKGRVEGILRVRCRSEDLLLDVREVSAARVAGELIKFLVMDDVQLTDATGEREVVSIHGPDAARVLTAAGFGELPTLSLTFVETEAFTVIRDDDLGVESYEVHAPSASETIQRLVDQGALPITAEDLDVVRVENGRPLDGVDVDIDTIPLEARLDEAIDHGKGCYIGQEVIARATHRGGVKHHLVGLRFEGAPPPVGAQLWAEGADKPTGELTSSVWSPALQSAIGLGYVRIEHEAPGTTLETRWAEGSARTTVCALPHVARPSDP